jgi:hypothetical protein
MKIVKFEAENIKKLKAVEITPEGHIVQISGPNAAGKTTVLDCIWYAMGGGHSLPEEPIRKGTAKAEINLDLGDLVVTRTFTHKGSYLRVMNKDGLEWKSPQKVLDKLVGRFSFDPQAFARLDETKQREVILSLVSIPLSYDHLQNISGISVPENGDPIAAMNAAYKTVYDKRADHNRNIKRTESAIASIQIPPDMQDLQPVSASGLLAERQRLEQENSRNKEQRDMLAGLLTNKERLQQELQHLHSQLESLKQLIAVSQDKLSGCETGISSQTHKVSSLHDHDLSQMDTRIAQVDEHNRIAGLLAQKQALKHELDEETTRARECTIKMDAITRYKMELMERTNFPIIGLDFQNGKVAYNNLPVSQASAAEKLRVGMAIAMALNPRLRVIRIEDGSLLDKQSWQVIEEMAAEGDYQVWIETVADAPGTGIYIHDGEILNGSKTPQLGQVDPDDSTSACLHECSPEPHHAPLPSHLKEANH